MLTPAIQLILASDPSNWSIVYLEIEDGHSNDEIEALIAMQVKRFARQFNDVVLVVPPILPLLPGDPKDLNTDRLWKIAVKDS